MSYAKERIVTAGGSITEIIYALDANDELVGVDMTSTYPQEVKSLPQIGYWKQLSIEGILSLKPSLFIAWQDSEPELIFEQLKNAHVATLRLQRVPNNLPLLLANIKRVANAINRKSQGEQLITLISSQVQSVEKLIQNQAKKPKVLFLFSISGTTQVSGKNTVADSVITLAGGENIATHDFYKNYSTEAIITANPDILLVTSQSLDAIGGKKNLSQFPGIIHTNAWKNNRIVSIDQALILGMGPRIGEAVSSLYNGFYRSPNKED
ncbi:heme/hemin ABC transporter substrate-binding protein [Orbus sturtevantii]|uniref:heme/hemin ABC transporter substrate-binding protein n=1 Tax=Orbus sturtevantii TaxID=3074109 RepID=UPI00370D9D0F